MIELARVLKHPSACAECRRYRSELSVTSPAQSMRPASVHAQNLRGLKPGAPTGLCEAS